jgi:hypothetical protein
MRHSTYKAIRDTLKPGDVLAWGGPGPVSAGIKFATRSNVSHVSIVLHTMCVGGMDPIVSMIESTSIGGGFSGVDIRRVSTSIEKYEGEVWLLPLKEAVWENLNIVDFTAWLITQKGKEYDTPGAIMSGLDGPVPDIPEDFSKLFCSELVTEGLEKGGIIEPRNASEQTPADVCRFNIYNETVQIKGRSLELLK